MRFPSPNGTISVATYALIAPLLILLQHAAVAIAYRASGRELALDAGFWLLPLRRLAGLEELSAAGTVLFFAFSLAVAWALALLSFRRAVRSDWGYALAALSLVPAIQIVAVAVLALLPPSSVSLEDRQDRGSNSWHMIQGVLAGIAIIVFAVLVSAISFGAYGWGLFVMTPFLVGFTTAYLANRRVDLTSRRTMSLVLWAATLGCLALITLALEGLICLVLAAPLGVILALAGGSFGRAAALARHSRGKPLMSVALLPAVFAFEAAMPPAVAIATEQSIDISAPPSAVWRALTSEDPIASSPGFVGRAGLAYPLRSRIVGEGVGATRLGHFSTGTAREQISEWVPGRRLAFRVLDQPPAMEEMSPYRRVNAPHVEGYFETGETGFDVHPLPGGGTRLSVRASHILRIDPVLYWEPVARWAIRENSARVLRDLKAKAEAAN